MGAPPLSSHRRGTGRVLRHRGAGVEGAARVHRHRPGLRLHTTFHQARGFNSTVRGVASAQDGSGDVWTVGDFTVYTDVLSRQLIRLHANGTRRAVLSRRFS